MKKAIIQILVDEELLAQAESVFQKFDLNVECAIQLFLEQTVKEQAIPFEVIDCRK